MQPFVRMRTLRRYALGCLGPIADSIREKGFNSIRQLQAIMSNENENMLTTQELLHI